MTTTLQMRRPSGVRRWLSPTGFVLAGLLLFLPFLTVSCDAPGGFGHAAPGGTTTYTGMDLVVGGAPEVTPPDKVRPEAEQRDDLLPPQPLAIAATVLIVAGFVITVAFGQALPRRGAAALIAGAAGIFLVANQSTATALLLSMVHEQISGPIPAGKQESDFVQTQVGFVVCVFTLLVLTLANGIGWARLRRRGSPDV